LKPTALITFLISCFSILSQKPAVIPISSLLHSVSNNDSIVYYQCHVEEATQQLFTASGQTLTSASSKYSITEKYVILKDSSFYRVKYFVSSLTVLPNRKFSGLKVREKPYWNFKLIKDTVLTERALKRLIAIESKGREATEYDFVINKYTTNQLIIKNRKNFRQLIIEGNYLLSKLLFT